MLNHSADCLARRPPAIMAMIYFVEGWVACTSPGMITSDLPFGIAYAKEAIGASPRQTYVSFTAPVLHSGWPEGQIALTVKPVLAKAIATRAIGIHRDAELAKTVGFTLLQVYDNTRGNWIMRFSAETFRRASFAAHNSVL